MWNFLKHPAVILVPVIAYFLGWTYLDNYFGAYGIPINNLELPLEHYFTLGFMALSRGAFAFGLYAPEQEAFWSQVMIWVSAALLLGAWLAPLGPLARWRQQVMAVVLLVAVSAAYFMVKRVAQENAMLEPPRVQIAFVEPGDDANETEIALSSDEDDVVVGAGDVATWAFLKRQNEYFRLRLIYWDDNAVVVGWQRCPAGAPAVDAAGDDGGGVPPVEITKYLDALGKAVWAIWVLPEDRVRMISFRRDNPDMSTGALREHAVSACARELAQDAAEEAADENAAEAATDETTEDSAAP